jgi:excisionase family DNA binding protein
MVINSKFGFTNFDVMINQLLQEILLIKDFITKQSLLNKDILNQNEAALYLGVSKSYLYKLTSSRTIPFYKPAMKLNYFSRAELDTWLLHNRLPTIKELSNINSRNKSETSVVRQQVAANGE